MLHNFTKSITLVLIICEDGDGLHYLISGRIQKQILLNELAFNHLQVIGKTRLGYTRLQFSTCKI